MMSLAAVVSPACACAMRLSTIPGRLSQIFWRRAAYKRTMMAAVRFRVSNLSWLGDPLARLHCRRAPGGGSGGMRERHRPAPHGAQKQRRPASARPLHDRRPDPGRRHHHRREAPDRRERRGGGAGKSPSSASVSEPTASACNRPTRKWCRSPFGMTRSRSSARLGGSSDDAPIPILSLTPGRRADPSRAGGSRAGTAADPRHRLSGRRGGLCDSVAPRS
jgi:hypothetical protein